MTKQYNQLQLFERKQIKQGLDRGDTFRQIASFIGRSPSTVSREVFEHRFCFSKRSTKVSCQEQPWCKKKNVCVECVKKHMLCCQCSVKDCRDVCKAYASKTMCQRMSKAPWVCNGCRKYRYGCHRANRFIYDANKAQLLSDEIRSVSRSGIDMDKDHAEVALARIKEGISRGLSPYEISTLYADTIGVSASTIYRWVEAGYGGLSNIELERKVGYRPRKKSIVSCKRSHSKKRRYDEFLKLSDELINSRTEMDCMQGCKTDVKAILTLYNVPTHIQLCILLESKDCENVKEKLKEFKVIAKPNIYKRWTNVVLTDNGSEFVDEKEIGTIFGEVVKDGKLCIHLYYCDPRQAQQKGSCEKNHSEIRQILQKGVFSFDDLNQKDLSVVMSHINSTPRASLGGKSPIDMLYFIYGKKAADSFLKAFGFKKIERDKLMLKPEILNIERSKRNEEPIEKLK